MQFDVKDGKVGGDRWVDRVFRQESEELSLNIFIPDSAAWGSFLSRYKLSTARADWYGAQKFVAKKWFRNFDGAKDMSGADIENTIENRTAMLAASKKLWDWLFGAIAEAIDEEAEGN